MNIRGEIDNRPDNSEKLKFYMRDSENSMLFSPIDHVGNKFFGTWNKVINLQSTLLYEDKEKYLNEF